MKQDNIVMVLLLGAAGYLVYKWMYPGTAAVAATPATPTPAPTPTTTASAPAITTTPPASTTTQPGVVAVASNAPAYAASVSDIQAAVGGKESIAALAAAGIRSASTAVSGSAVTYDPVQVASALGIKYNSDEWNFFRGVGGGDVPNVDLFPVGNRNYQMTIEEYLQARTSAGLSGLDGRAYLGWDFPFYGVPN